MGQGRAVSESHGAIDFVRMFDEEKKPWPDAWSLTGFPHPNPYLPSPPRPRAGWPLWFSGPLFALAGPLVIWILKDGADWIGNWSILAAGVAFVGFVCGLVSFLTGLSRLPWRAGRIIPAIVESRAEGPPRKDSGGCAMVLLPPPLGLVAGLLTSATQGRDPDAIIVSFTHNGELVHKTVNAGEHWGHWDAGDVIWVIRAIGGRVLLLPFVAPADFADKRPPLEVVRWTRHSVREAEIAAANPATRQLERERAQAARANTKAINERLR
jgi:hypothetical protein